MIDGFPTILARLVGRRLHHRRPLLIQAWLWLAAEADTLQQKRRRLNLVILTHPEVDHVGGLVEVLERYEVGLVLDSGQECSNATCERWSALIEDKVIPYRKAEAGMQVTVSGAVLLDILHPPGPLMSGTSSDINNNSVVLRLQYGQLSALLTGDVMEEAEGVLLLSGQPLHSLMLKVPHHGGDTSLTTPFLEAIVPELAVISDSSNIPTVN